MNTHQFLRLAAAVDHCRSFAEHSSDPAVSEASALCQLLLRAVCLCWFLHRLCTYGDREILTCPIGECPIQVPNVPEMPAGLCVHRMESLRLGLLRLWRCPQDSRKRWGVPQGQDLERGMDVLVGQNLLGTVFSGTLHIWSLR